MRSQPLTAQAYLIARTTSDPLIGIRIVDVDMEAHHTNLTAREARMLGFMLLALASESGAQGGYITALRELKMPEDEVMSVAARAAKIMFESRSA